MSDWPHFAHVPDLGYLQSPKPPEAAMEVYRAEFDAAYELGGLWISIWHPHVSGRPARLLAWSEADRVHAGAGGRLVRDARRDRPPRARLRRRRHVPAPESVAPVLRRPAASNSTGSRRVMVVSVLHLACQTRCGGRPRPRVRRAGLFGHSRRSGGFVSGRLLRPLDAGRAVRRHRRVGRTPSPTRAGSTTRSAASCRRAGAAAGRARGARETLRGGVVTTTRVAMDIGGTFTDFVVVDEAARHHVSGKVLTTPANPAEGVLDGPRAVRPRARRDRVPRPRDDGRPERVPGAQGHAGAPAHDRRACATRTRSRGTTARSSTRSSTASPSASCRGATSLEVAERLRWDGVRRDAARRGEPRADRREDQGGGGRGGRRLPRARVHEPRARAARARAPRARVPGALGHALARDRPRVARVRARLLRGAERLHRAARRALPRDARARARRARGPSRRST